VLFDMVDVILDLDDDTTPTNKLRFVHIFLVMLADELDIELEPSPPPDVGSPELSKQDAQAESSKLSSSGEAEPSLSDKPRQATMAPKFQTADATPLASTKESENQNDKRDDITYAASTTELDNRENDMDADNYDTDMEDAVYTSPTGESDDYNENREAELGVKDTISVEELAITSNMPVDKEIRAQIAWSDNIPIDTVDSMREELERRLTKETFSFQKNRKTSEIQLTKDEVSNLIDFVFERVFGQTGLTRATEIVKAVRMTNGENQLLTASVIAANLAHDDTVPSQLQSFFRYYSSYSRESILPDNPAFQMLRFYERVQMYNEYLELIKNPSDKTTQRYLERLGHKTSTGRGWKTVVHDYLKQTLGLSNTQLNNQLQENQPLYTLATTFGAGILVFIPGSASNLSVSLSSDAAIS
jgi:hypothetical protein